jgi:TonB family protein
LSNDLQTFKRIKSAAGPEISESAVRVADAAETPTRWHRETHGSASTAPAAVSLEPETLPNYVAARALKQVLPDTKLFAVSEIREGAEVDVQARIDEKGVVVEAHVKNGTNDNGSLRSAALEAARQWVFEPAKMGNRNIPSDHTIAFQFH